MRCKVLERENSNTSGLFMSPFQPDPGASRFALASGYPIPRLRRSDSIAFLCFTPADPRRLHACAG